MAGTTAATPLSPSPALSLFSLGFALLEHFPEILWSNYEHWRNTTSFYSPGSVRAIEPVIKGSVYVIPGHLERVFKTQRGNPDWPEELKPNRSPNNGPRVPPGQRSWRPKVRPAGRGK